MLRKDSNASPRRASLYRRPSSAMSKLHRGADAPLIIRTQEGSSFRGASTAGAGMGTESPFTAFTAEARTGSPPSPSSPLKLKLTGNNVSFRSLYGEALRNGLGGPSINPSPIMSPTVLPASKSSLSVGEKSKSKPKADARGRSRSVFKGAILSKEDSVLTEELKKQQALPTHGPTLGFRIVGRDSKGKVVRQDQSTRLYWRECQNVAVIEREATMYNYIVSHTPNFAASKPAIATSPADPRRFSSALSDTDNFAGPTPNTMTVGNRTIPRVPDFATVPTRRPHIETNHLLRLMGNDQRYIVVDPATTTSSTPIPSGSASLAMSLRPSSALGGSSTRRPMSGSVARSLRSTTSGGHSTSSSSHHRGGGEDGSFSSLDMDRKLMYRVVPFLISEGYECTLDEALRRPEVSMPEVLSYLKDTALQLAELHRIGVVYNICTTQTIVLCAPTEETTTSSAAKISKDPSTIASGKLVAKLSNMSCITISEDDRIRDLAHFTMRQQRAAPSTSPYHMLPLEFLPDTLHGVPPEWLQQQPQQLGRRRLSIESPNDMDLPPPPAAVTKTKQKKKVDLSGGATVMNESAIPAALESSYARSSSLVDGGITRRMSDLAFDTHHSSISGSGAESQLQKLKASTAEVIPTNYSESYVFGKLMSFTFLQAPTTYGTKFVDTEEVGQAEMKHLIDCLLHKEAASRWLVEHAVVHPVFWSPVTIRAFLGLVLKYVGAIDDGFRRPSVRQGRSTTTKTLAKRRRRPDLSHELLVWVNQPVLWLNHVTDWYDAICRDNQEGVRYDYESSVEDQLQFFVNVYSHLLKHHTQTICGGDAGKFATRFVHQRFAGFLHVVAHRVMANRDDEQQFLLMLDQEVQSHSLFGNRGATFTAPMGDAQLTMPFGQSEPTAQRASAADLHFDEVHYSVIEKYLRRLATDITEKRGHEAADSSKG